MALAVVKPSPVAITMRRPAALSVARASGVLCLTGSDTANNPANLPSTARYITLEPSLRFYTQHDNQGVKLNRISPGLRASYRLSDRASILGESIVEHSRTNGPANHDTTNSIFFYFGYRYELF